MRQAGVLAAAGIYALDNNIKRLATDHQHAKAIGDTLRTKSFVGEMYPVETNIIIFEITGKYKNAHEFTHALKRKDILAMPMSPTQVRIVTHLDITEKMAQKTISEIKKL